MTTSRGTYTITLPWPPKELSPNARVHWATKARAAKKYRADCCILAKAAGVRPFDHDGSLDLDIEFHPPDKRQRDSDNLISSFKSGRDGVADALRVNDARFNGFAFSIKEPVKGGCVRVRVEA